MTSRAPDAPADTWRSSDPARLLEGVVPNRRGREPAVVSRGAVVVLQVAGLALEERVGRLVCGLRDPVHEPPVDGGRSLAPTPLSSLGDLDPQDDRVGLGRIGVGGGRAWPATRQQMTAQFVSAPPIPLRALQPELLLGLRQRRERRMMLK